MAVLMRKLADSPHIESKICVTAQHRGMLDEVLRIFKIKPDYDLNVMQDGQSLEYISRQIIDKMSPVIKKEKPDLILVHGDTSTSFLAALCAFYQRVPVGHVEAGLRSNDLDHPFPEEGNRRLTDALAKFHFAPTDSAKNNLMREAISPKNIIVTGNTVIDSLKWAVAQRHSFRDQNLKKIFNGPEIKKQKVLLLTAHRRENFGRPLENVCKALRQVVCSHPEVLIIYPVHPNPNVVSVAKKILKNQARIELLAPLDYLDMAHLLKASYLVVTDSGGLQEEAPSLGKPVLVLRNVTERPEAVKAGAAKVIGTDSKKVYNEIASLLKSKAAYLKMANAVNPYGDGQASSRILDSILYFNRISKVKPRVFIP